MKCYNCIAALYTGMGLLLGGSPVRSFMLRVLHHSGSLADDATEESRTVFVARMLTS